LFDFCRAILRGGRGGCDDDGGVDAGSDDERSRPSRRTKGDEGTREGTRPEGEMFRSWRLSLMLLLSGPTTSRSTSRWLRVRRGRDDARDAVGAEEPNPSHAGGSLIARATCVTNNADIFLFTAPGT
jgi:hypothetical protein